MTREDKQLLFKDLCARLPYFPMVHWRNADVVLTPVMLGLYTNEECKPYLRPLSSMTVEERLYFHRNSSKVQILIDAEKIITKSFYGYTIHLLDWLNAHHFDYRGLILRGLALEAPEGMYD